MSESVAGLVLAGGLSRRMGADKPLCPLGGRPLIAHVIERLEPQCGGGLVLNANGGAGRYAAFGLPVVPDGIPGFAGPLAGILAGMDHLAARRPAVALMVSAPADAPFLPRDLVARLTAARAAAGVEVAVAASAGRDHPVVALWPVALRDALREALAQGLRRVGMFAAQRRAVTADWPAEPVDPFFNANTADELEAAERLAALRPR
ncbi:molybdenum cofactor guanylyltransferase MobA [Chelatococcus reniformis]|uniref:Molybdenum cofactor guanylyltransferase n=1 Tax=Chelatococcus reniformis TaxID=1494448 RepID=A0A916UX95_9HYPH|nr:molybdenum cofactor guanylyltransferase MobA [Chelatococcus reniformis]GGC92227.1 molybdenum cofactor guanylyltransferase [Chelatococcus reniformis]